MDIKSGIFKNQDFTDNYLDNYRAAYEKQYQVFRKLLKVSYKEIALSEIMDCIDEIIIYPNKNITVKWVIAP